MSAPDSAKRFMPVIPEWVAAMPALDKDAAACPNCGALLDPAPKRGRRCVECDQKFYCRTCPDGVRRVLTEDAMIEVECLWAEANAERNVTIATFGHPGEHERIYQEALEATRADMRRGVLRHHGRG